MNYSDSALSTEIFEEDHIQNSSELDLALDSAIASEEEALEKKSDKRIKAHVVRRNVEDYLERKALEKSLKDVFDDYLLD
ncbi:MAG TPA: hypothetical protein EYG71_02225 [Leucothrix sp.]|nr:hypothetical protein [Leucothrix sp.]